MNEKEIDIDKEIETEEDGGNLDISIGLKVRQLRKMRNVSLQQLSEETKMSYSFLSRLENGKHSISIVSLQRLAKYFNVDLIYFLDNKDSSIKLMRKDDKLDFLTEEGISFSIGSSKTEKNLQVSYYNLPPASPQERHVHTHKNGEEFIIVTEGEASIMIEGEKYQLNEGDSILFSSEVEHTIYTESKGAKLILVASPPYGRDVLE